MRALLAALLVAALAGAAIAHGDKGDNGDKKEKMKKYMEMIKKCKEDSGVSDDDLSKLKEKTTELPTSDAYKEFNACVIKGSEIISESGAVDKEKCEKMATWMSRKRDQFAEGLKQCCSSVEGDSFKDKCYNLALCMKKALGEEPMWQKWKGKKGGKCQGGKCKGGE